MVNNDQLALQAPHSGIYLEEKDKPKALASVTAPQSNSDKTVEVNIEATGERFLIGCKTSTLVQEVQDMIGSWKGCHGTDIIIKRKTVHGPQTLRFSDEIPSSILVSGFALNLKQEEPRRYPHPILIIGCGLGGLQHALQSKDTGYEFIMVDRNHDMGGHSWMNVPNKFTKLQTERGTYHINYLHKPWDPVPKKLKEMDYKTWPTRNMLLTMMREGAEEHGLYKHAMLNTNIEKVKPKGDMYLAQYVPVNETEGDGGMIVSSAVITCPGFLHDINEVTFNGEDDFDGYIEYASQQKCDYELCRGNTVVVYGHGAFTIENVRTLVEHCASKIWVICRTRNLSGTKMASWMVGASHRPISGVVLLDALKKMYDLVGFDVWKAHSVQCDSKKTTARIAQKTIFGVTDIYFLAGYYKLMECVVDEIKRLSDHMVHTKKYQKIEADCILKATGTKPSHVPDKTHGIKYTTSSWINGDPLRFIMLGVKGVNAQNYSSFSVGPGLAPDVVTANWFIQRPQDFALVKDSFVVRKADHYPAYVCQIDVVMSNSMGLSAAIPALGAKLGEVGAIKARKHNMAHPLEEYLAECAAEWEGYIKHIRENGLVGSDLVDDRPDPPYPYTLEESRRLQEKAERIANGEKLHADGYEPENSNDM